MENFGTVIQEFLNALEAFTGAKPVFSIDYQKKEVLIITAPSGFVKGLAKNDKANLHLTKEGLTFTLFT